MAGFNGSVQWLDLLARPLLACLDAVYDFCRRSPDNVETHVPIDVLSELALNLSLFALWDFELDRPWLGGVVASDAGH